MTSTLIKPTSMTSRHRYIQYYMNNNPNCQETSFKRSFELTEECYKFMCSVLIDNNEDVLEYHELSKDDYHKCMSLLYKMHMNKNEYDKARNIYDYMVINVDIDPVKLLTLEFRSYCLDHTETYKNDIVEFHKIMKMYTYTNAIINTNVNTNVNAPTSSNKIEEIIKKLFKIMVINKNTISANALKYIYDINKDKHSIYLLNVFILDNKYYKTLDEKNKIEHSIRYYETANSNSYDKILDMQLNNPYMQERYWNLALAESYYSDTEMRDKNLYKTIHDINYFYELFSQEYDDNVLNYDIQVAHTVRNILYTTILSASCCIILYNDSKNLLKLSNFSIEHIATELSKILTSGYDMIYKSLSDNKEDVIITHKIVAESMGLECRHYVEYCCVCFEYVIVNKIKNCSHKICVSCCNKLIDKLCPQCRVNIT